MKFYLMHLSDIFNASELVTITLQDELFFLALDINFATKESAIFHVKCKFGKSPTGRVQLGLLHCPGDCEPQHQQKPSQARRPVKEPTVPNGAAPSEPQDWKTTEALRSWCLEIQLRNKGTTEPDKGTQIQHLQSPSGRVDTIHVHIVTFNIHAHTGLDCRSCKSNKLDLTIELFQPEELSSMIPREHLHT